MISRLALRRGQVVVVVEPAADLGTWAGLRAATPPEIALVACGSRSASGDGSIVAFPGSIAEAVSRVAPADIAIVAAGVTVRDGWLGRLRDAAYADSANATASAVRVADLGADGVHRRVIEQIAVRGSLSLHPRLSEPDRACVYVRRSALDLVGPYDGAFGARALQQGLAHVLADRVVVDAPASPGPRRDSPIASTPPVRRALGALRRSVSGLAVTIDARVLSGPMQGSHVHVLELIGALAAQNASRVTVLMPSEPAPHATSALSRLSGLRLAFDVDQAAGADILHRPVQIDTPADLAVASALAPRLIITQQDLIGYHNPAYSPAGDDWLRYRELTRSACAVADHVIFFSEHVRGDALAEELLEPHRGTVVPIGVDHELTGSHAPQAPPSLHGRLGDERPVVLCLGTDLRHKNRPFAIRILVELSRRGWSGALVFAGPHVKWGSSAAEETEALTREPAVAASVIDVGPVSEAEKTWLLQRADLVLYPTVSEGFGLIPFEAAEHDRPCLWAPGSALSEFLPDSAAGISCWDAVSAADEALRLMASGAPRTDNVAAIRSAAQPLRWARSASRLIELYAQVCDGPAAPAAARERATGFMRSGISEDAMRLVGPGGVLPAKVERPLLALATHRRVAGPAFAALRAGYAAVYRWRRR